MAYNNHYVIEGQKQIMPYLLVRRAVLVSVTLFVAAFLIITSLELPATYAAATQLSIKLSPPLQNTLQQIAPDETIRVIIHLKESANLSALTLSEAEVPRREQVMVQLQKTAVSAQSQLLPQLQTFQQTGNITQYRPFWIINAIAVTGTPDAVAKLATHSSVERIELDHQRQYFTPPESAFVAHDLLQTTAVFTTPIQSWGINRVRAPQTWHGLDIDGTGVTVAIMDSGVDWQHPDLLPNYRGNLGGGTFDHTASWYFTPDPTITEPVDFLGHGTHVAGTAVGQNGIGVAPGAKWIAVGLTNETGLIFDSDVHAGFEWLLAPNGDPSLAPDVINNSWGSSSIKTTFLEDINTLHAAGIVTVFSAGNSGPVSKSIETPAAYTDTLAIAATNIQNEVAWFSSRGPSPLTSQQTPQISAPGTAIFSALPDNKYGTKNGTSMAAPHVTGAIALLLSANPALTRTQLLDSLQNTAVSIAPPHPNNNTGWGLLDVYAATTNHVSTGFLQGALFDDGTPLPGVSISITNSTGYSFSLMADSNGVYQAALAPGNYTIHTSLFGFEPYTSLTQTITFNQTTVQDIHFIQKPSGTVQGVVSDAKTGDPLANVVIAATGTPITAVTDTNGRYSLTLPVQQHKLTASRNGYQIDRITLLLDGSNNPVNFALTSTDSILFVDAGEWIFDPQLDIFQDSLSALNYTFDTWAIRDPYSDIPDDLTGYDIVIWSDPYYSPGTVGANSVITNFLKSGGNLIITGQNIAARDGNIFSSQSWWYDYMGGIYEGKTTHNQSITGTPNSTFSDISLALNGGSSVSNQNETDIVGIHSASSSEPIFYYDNDQIAGFQAGRCQPYHAVFLGFGLEGVAHSQDRAAVLQASFDYFDTPPTVAKVEWMSNPINKLAFQGEQIEYRLTLRNLSDTYTDTFTIDPDHNDWPVTVISPTITLGPCETGAITVTIQVPTNISIDTKHMTELTAVSSINPSVSSSFYLHHKTPRNILLVDDDRWYDQETLFQAHLDNLGLSYDVWSTEYTEFGINPSPTAENLQAYDLIIWFTGYDWFAPITVSEREAITSFLENGGRLFLTSQDFLFYNRNTPLVQDYLGVFNYQESITPTQIYGGAIPGLNSDLAGPISLEYGPYRNFSDGIIPFSEDNILFWSDVGLPAAITHDTNTYRAVFMSIPFETITETAQTAVMNHIVGWLGDLGDSTFEVDQAVGSPGNTRTYTITIHNNSGGNSNHITMNNILPDTLIIDPNSIQGGATYHAITQTLTWQGSLADNHNHQIVYEAAIAPGTAAGSRIENAVSFHYDKHNLSYEQFATVWVDAPDLTSSTINVTTDRPFAATAVTYTFQIHNSGNAPANNIQATFNPRQPLNIDPDSLAASTGSSTAEQNGIFWTGSLNPGETTTVTINLTRTASTRTIWYPTTLILEENTTGTQLIEHRLILSPYQRYLPFIAKN